MPASIITGKARVTVTVDFGDGRVYSAVINAKQLGVDYGVRQTFPADYFPYMTFERDGKIALRIDGEVIKSFAAVPAQPLGSISNLLAAAQTRCEFQAILDALELAGVSETDRRAAVTQAMEKLRDQSLAMVALSAQKDWQQP